MISLAHAAGYLREFIGHVLDRILIIILQKINYICRMFAQIFSFPKLVKFGHVVFDIIHHMP